jgi:hypothetical protein
MLETSALRKQVLQVISEMGLNLSEEMSSREEFMSLNRDIDITQGHIAITHPYEDVTDHLIFIPLLDIHWGLSACYYEAARAYRDYILNTPNCVAGGLGDLAETATKGSVGMSIYETIRDPDQQIDDLVEFLGPLADEKKLLFLHDGNHEFRARVLLKRSPMKTVARELKVPYIPYQGYHLFKVGAQTYKVMTSHGKGGGFTKGAKYNSIAKMALVAPEMDLYIQGHVHQIAEDNDIVFNIDPETEKVVAHRRKFVIGGSLVSYFNTYAEMGLYPPSTPGLVRISFDAVRKDIQVTH